MGETSFWKSTIDVSNEDNFVKILSYL